MGSIIRPEATLEERWEARTGPVLLTGTHALVRLHFFKVLDWSGDLVMREGQQMGIFDISDCSQERVIALATGQDQVASAA